MRTIILESFKARAIVVYKQNTMILRKNVQTFLLQVFLLEKKNVYIQNYFILTGRFNIKMLYTKGRI